MVKINRKQFMMLGVGAAAGAVGTACGMGGGGAEDGVRIDVYGSLHNVEPGGFPDIRIHYSLAGPKSDLSGTGYDFGQYEDKVAAAKSSCFATQVGQITDDKLILGGLALLVGDPNNSGSLVSTQVDLKTGETTWSFGPIPAGPFAGQTPVFKGQVTVLMHDVPVRVAAKQGAPESGTPEEPARGM